MAAFLLGVVPAGVDGTLPAAMPGPVAPAGGDAIRAPQRHPPAPFLASAGLILEVQAAELGIRGPLPGQGVRSADPLTVGPSSFSTVASRIPVIQLRHDSFATFILAARAGLLARGATSPPPPLG